MFRSYLSSILQNKNVVMFITALMFMAGILAFFSDSAILISAIFSIIIIFFILKNLLPFKYLIFWILIFYFGFFNSYFRVHTSDDLVSFAGNKVDIKGQIVNIPNTGNKIKTKFFFKVYEINGIGISGKTFVTVGTENNNIPNFQIGKYYEMQGSLKTPFKAGNPSQFDYGKYLRNFDTFTVFYTDANSCKYIEENLSLKWKFLQKLNITRDRINLVHSQILKSPNLEILGGIVFGDDAIAPPDYIKASFVNSGLLHILAASGMNVAFIYGFWLFFMRRLRVPFKITVISGIGLIIIYTFMTGLGASVIRAALMLIFILIGKLIDRDAHSISLLAFVAMLMLIYNPAYINDVGFQLSFIVTFGLLTTANSIFERFKDSKLLTIILNILLIPVIAQIWVAPIQMFYFNTFSTYSILANIASFPFLSVVSFGGFISSILGAFSPFTDKVCYIFDFLLNYFLNAIVLISNYFAGLKNSLIVTTHPSIIQIIIYYAILLLLTLSVKTGINKKIIYYCFALLIFLGLSTINIPNNSLEIITFDVQNADCFLVKTPKNKYFIIDTGRASFRGSKAQANSIIIKYLKDNGIKNIEGMIITHFDNDHSGGAVSIMENINVKKVYVNSLEDNTMTSSEIFKTIHKAHIPAEIPDNLIYTEPNLNIKTYISNLEKDNEKSIITLITYKDFDMIFMGDAGILAFESIKEKIPNNIEVLKVGHHGGLKVVNENMLNHLNTKVSIISTGPNSFGHPNRITLDILRNTKIYRTDRHNSIKIQSNGTNYNIFTYSPSRHRYESSAQLSAN